MSKFRKDGEKELPPISTASLPDIVFMLLFFFMVSTTMREVTLNVDIKLPEATELSKLMKKSLVSYIYVGEPKKQFQSMFGKAPRIQLNDQWANVSDIQDYVIAEREARDEAEQKFMITSLKIDENTKMGIVSDIKQELRKSAALHINYSSRRKVER
ncbi:MAG: biopolymer transporter ExbD [Draconibacterium sp.]|nr:biopolymer transporter ExbD [Draconibacterium sp.]